MNDRRKSERRKYIRVDSPALVILDKDRYLVSDWSAGGFQINGLKQQVKIGDCLPIQLRISFKSSLDISLKALVEVTWLTQTDKSAGFNFVSLESYERQLLNDIIDDILEGENIAADDINITEDIETKLTNLEAVKNKKDNSHKQRKKFWLELILLFSLGSLIITAALLALYRAIIYIEIKQAAMKNPVEIITSNHRGLITNMYVKQGQEVKKNEFLFSMFDEQMAQFVGEDQERSIDNLIRDQLDEINRLNELIEINYLNLYKAKFDLINAEKLRNKEIQKLKYSQIVSQEQLAADRAKVTALTKQHIEAEKELKRLEFLIERGGVAQRQVDLARANLAKITGDLEIAHRQVSIAKTVLDAMPTGSFYNGERFAGELAKFEAAVEDANNTITVLQQKINVLETQRTKYKEKITQLQARKTTLKLPKPSFENPPEENLYSVVYKSPVAGRIIKVYNEAGTAVNIGRRMLLIQSEITNPTVEAYFTEDQVSHLEIGNLVEVKIPELNKTHTGKIIVIDRRGGFFDDIRARYQYEGSADNPNYVEIRIIDISDADKQKLLPGMSVRIKYRKNRFKIDRLLAGS